MYLEIVSKVLMLITLHEHLTMNYEERKINKIKYTLFIQTVAQNETIFQSTKMVKLFTYFKRQFENHTI